MDRATKKSANGMILRDLKNLDGFYNQEIKKLTRIGEEKTELLKSLFEQGLNKKTRRLMPKTPKVSRKRIRTIPEDGVIIENSDIKNNLANSNELDSEDDSVPTRSRRGASIKASQNIKKQQSLTLNAKLRRPSPVNDEQKMSRTRQLKRLKTSSSESDEDLCRKPAKQNKTGEGFNHPSIIIKEEPMSCTEQDDEVEPQRSPKHLPKNSIIKTDFTPRRSSRRSSAKSLNNINVENSNIIEETLVEPDTSITEPSLYEDAVGRPVIANSTMNPNSTVTIDKKMMNVTVVLNKMDETVTISRNQELPAQVSLGEKIPTDPISSVLQSKMYLQNKLSAFKTNLKTPEFDELITDDESSESCDNINETKKKMSKLLVKKSSKPKQSLESEDTDEAISSPEEIRTKSQLKYKKTIKPKQNALFSPYAKESVKKRVEAFEKAVIDTPNEKIETAGRITRTKTRAMAKNNTEPSKTLSVSTVLARKSLSRAKKIIREKELRDHEAEKENNLLNTEQKPTASKNDKTQKQQSRTTPISKSRLQMPMSVSRIPRTPIGIQLIHSSKAATASKVNYGTSSTETNSVSKPLAKSSSTDSVAEKRHKSATEEDARRKKEDALKAQTEERRRRREEKEQKIKLAREARDKMEQAKRLKLEKEKEEKARHAIIMQEKLREEAEKKKIALSQRVLEKEEKRKREEQLKLQRIQEQEELERRLADQKRREQEAERRRLAEARAEQLAVAETAKLKQQYQAKVKLMQLKQQEAEANGPTSYKIDSEPDDDESDCESRPKHTIPYWAKREIRKVQVEMQPYIPISIAMKFFGSKRSTPDLSEIFVGIKKDRLVRTSSAVWKTPPRFSMMED